ncbi:MAG: PQQ-binding-like beta-propeller repeat protein, partial [Lentisphaerae bacterium]|nr:PQQ-binding-like beta-propeller repeat protein [Lentisphaerota bacterium]
MGPRNRTTIAVACAVLHLATFHALAGGWRMYRGGLGRTSVTAEKLTFPLAATWVYEPRHSPSPAWPEPGKELHRMDFDYAFHPVSADGFVYFGSSSDDTVRALEADTGKEVWRFTTGGPVRFAPALANGKVYVASDDGHVTCLDARTGALGWRFRAAPRDGLILGNGRMISRWPLRSGVLVEDGVVYVTAGMWPTRGIFVYALEAETGKQLWSNDGTGGTYINLPHVVSSGFSGVAPQGYLALSGDVLLVPTGRSVPAAFDRHTGRLLHYTPYTHGHTKHGAASITAVGDLYFHREESSLNLVPEHVGEAQPCSRNHMTAYELASGKISIRLLGVYDLLASDDVLYAVGNNKLVALDLAWLRNANKPYYKCLDYPAGHEAVRWTTPQPRVYSLALTGRALVIGGADTIRALGTETGRELWSATVEGQVRGLAVADGRLIAATDKGTLTCFEHAAEPSGPASRNRERSGEPSGIAEQYTAAAARILEATGVARGYALIVGEGDTRLAAALAAQTDLHVVVAFSPGADPARERERLLAAGLLGGRVVVHALDGQASLPFPHYFANLVIVTGGVENTPGEGIYRCLRPCGGVLHFSGSGKEKAKQLVAAARIPQQEISGDGHTIRRGALPGAGEWRYQWADGGRTGVGKESRVRLPFDILWFGGPGPDRMMDRHYASSPPLAVNGRVFVTGRHHVIAMDAYNGCELWCRDLPDAGRRYAQYFSGNFAADGDSLFVATDRRCHRLDQATGKTTHVYQVPESLARDVSAESPNAADDAAPVPPELKERAWGYTSVTENMVIGSYTGPVTNTHKPWVSQGESTAVFALDKNGGSLLWIYRAKRKIGNTKIAFGEGKLFLLDATSYADIYAARRRNETYATEQTLIALDLATGRELWKQQDVPSLQPPRTYDPNGKHARYDKSLQMPYRGWTPYVGHLQYSNGLVVVSASAAYEAAGGRKLWEAKTSLGKTPIIHGDW